MLCAGGEVFVIGHAAWNSRHGLNATVTAGVISKLVSHHAVPVLIQVVSTGATTLSSLASSC